MSIKNKEYYFSISDFKRPSTVEGKNAIGVRLMELIMMEPGDDPLHPDMGVGLKTFRYGTNTLNQLKSRVEDQIATYLPFYQGATVSIVKLPSKVVNIEIGIGDMVYIYDSENMTTPITLDDVVSG